MSAAESCTYSLTEGPVDGQYHSMEGRSELCMSLCAALVLLSSLWGHIWMLWPQFLIIRSLDAGFYSSEPLPQSRSSCLISWRSLDNYCVQILYWINNGSLEQWAEFCDHNNESHIQLSSQIFIASLVTSVTPGVEANFTSLPLTKKLEWNFPSALSSSSKWPSTGAGHRIETASPPPYTAPNIRL